MYIQKITDIYINDIKCFGGKVFGKKAALSREKQNPGVGALHGSSQAAYV